LLGEPGVQSLTREWIFTEGKALEEFGESLVNSWRMFGEMSESLSLGMVGDISENRVSHSENLEGFLAKVRELEVNPKILRGGQR